MTRPGPRSILEVSARSVIQLLWAGYLVEQTSNVSWHVLEPREVVPVVQVKILSCTWILIESHIGTTATFRLPTTSKWSTSRNKKDSRP